MNLSPLTDEQLLEVEQMSAANFSIKQMAVFFRIKESEFRRYWNDPENEVRLAYERGSIQASFNIINKQRELAEGGNITAAQVFLKEKEAQKIENIRNSCLYD